MKKFISLLLTVIMLVSTIGIVPVYASEAEADTVLEQVGDALFSEDFTSYELGEYTKEQLNAKQPNTSFGSTWTQEYEVKQTQSGKKYLSIAAPAYNTGGGYIVNLSEPFTSGTLVAEMKVLPQANPNNISHIWRYFRVQGEGSYNYDTIATSLGNNLYKPGCNESVFTSVDDAVDNMPKPDGDGFWNLRLVLNRETVSDKWSLTIYDDVSGKVIVSNPSITRRESKNITRIYFVNMWGDVSDPTGQCANIADLKIYIPKAENTDYNIENLKVNVGGEEVPTVPGSGSSISVSGSVTHSSEAEQNGIVFLVVYDVNDNLKGCARQDMTVSKESPFSLNLSIEENLTLAQGDYAKLIFIEDLNTLKPLRVAEVLAASQF